MAPSEPIVRGAITNELWVAARYGQEFMEQLFRAEGADPNSYTGLIAFIGVLQPVTRTRLAEATGLRRTTVRDGVTRLMELGRVLETPNPRDRRSTLLTLTSAGQEIVDRGLPIFHKLLDALNTALGGQLHVYEDSVRTVRIALQQLVDEPPERDGPD